MITPRFELLQDEKTLTITIRAPYCSLRELEVEVEDDTFLFLCKPYYLRLRLPGSIQENDNTRSSFDSEKGEFTFCYEKCNFGEEFPDLSFITKFLVTKVDASYGEEGERKITVLANEEYKEEKDQLDTFDINKRFGFAFQSNHNFISVSSEFTDLFEIDPCEVSLPERKKLRLQYEQGKFDMGHYLADFLEDGEINDLICIECPWNTITEIQFSNKELDFLKDLHNVEYNLNENQITFALNGLIDILYAYCYDKRSTSFEGNSESGWTIVKLSASLCWLDAFQTPKEALISAFRRSVIYPLYRNYRFCVQVFEDLKKLLTLGEKFIMKCLIEIYYIFLGGDCCRYVLNNLFIKDYIIYIMKWDKHIWQKLLNEVMELKIKKEDLGLNLSEIENGFSLDEKVANLKIKDSDSDDASTADSDDSSDETDSDSDSSETEDELSNNR